MRVPENPDEHYNYSHQEHEQRYTVHTMHQAVVDAARTIRIAFFNIEIREDLPPYALFHSSFI
jgi:hypothetical protein